MKKTSTTKMVLQMIGIKNAELYLTFLGIVFSMLVVATTSTQEVPSLTVVQTVSSSSFVVVFMVIVLVISNITNTTPWEKEIKSAIDRQKEISEAVIAQSLQGSLTKTQDLVEMAAEHYVTVVEKFSKIYTKATINTLIGIILFIVSQILSCFESFSSSLVLFYVMPLSIFYIALSESVRVSAKQAREEFQKTSDTIAKVSGDIAIIMVDTAKSLVK